MSCSRWFLFETLHEIIQVDTFLEKASEKFEMSFFQLSRLSKFELKFLYPELISEFWNKIVNNTKNY